MTNPVVNVTKKSEAEAVAELAARGAAVQLLTVTDDSARTAQVLVTRSDRGALEVAGVKAFLDAYDDFPERRKGVARLGDLASFISHASRFKSAHSAIFADDTRGAPKLVSVLNYHPQGPAFEGPDERPADWCDHRGVYAFPLSDEWVAWNKDNKEALSQQAFAALVEGRILDVVEPALAGEAARKVAEAIGATLASPAKVLELSRGLSVRVGAQVKNVVNLGTGEVQVNFVTEHSDADGSPLKVPGAFLVAIPVFRNGPLYQLAARLRYRAKEGAIMWWYELHGADRVFDHAFREACDTAARDTGLPLFVGTPEA